MVSLLMLGPPVALAYCVAKAIGDLRARRFGFGAWGLISVLTLLQVLLGVAWFWGTAGWMESQ